MEKICTDNFGVKVKNVSSREGSEILRSAIYNRRVVYIWKWENKEKKAVEMFGKKENKHGILAFK